jgi:hypothetical protein
LAASTSLTDEQRSMRARLAALARWAQPVDRAEALAVATAASPARLAYWEAKVDPAGTLDPTIRAQAAESARKAHFARLAFESSRARQARKRGAA